MKRYVAILAMLASAAVANDEEAANLLLHVATFGGAGAVEAPAIPSTGLVSWWRPSTYLDGTDSISGHNLTTTGGVTVGASGYRFAGTYTDVDADEAAYASYTADHYATNFTVGLLIYRHANEVVGGPGNPAVRTYVDRSAGVGVYGWTLEKVSNNTSVRLLTSGNATYVIATYSGSLNTQTGVWQHYCATYDGSAAKLYIDGVLVKSTAGSMTISNAPDSVVIGARNADLDNHENNQDASENANIDEITLYSVALTSNEIINLATTLLGTK